ncbi:MAG: methane monooxygenase/ammonia monooxygenase subunit C [Gammaproteobacteria bacterium]|nr:MAG: methane monooxygenase/ammonia monooxygenase subunit C [Gammaproteobacteria bacterium]
MSVALPNKALTEDNAVTAEIETLKIPWLLMFTLLIGTLLIFGTYRWYQQNYSFTVGLDYFEPEFQTYWMNLFYVQMALIIISTLIIAPTLWFTRPKDIHAITPIQELNNYYLVFGLMSVASVGLLISLGLFVEADAAWHQITIRDTDFTPTHIALFYFALPLIFASIAIAFVWVHTRLPDFSQRVSLPMAITVGGPILIMPNLAFNEWGHTFFYAEELFAAPIHWGFVALAWGFFAVGGFILQCLARVKVLTNLTHQEQPPKDQSEPLSNQAA